MSASCFIASGCQIATTHLYRCLHLQEQLRDLGYETRVAIWNNPAEIVPEEALGFDLLFLYRLSMSAPLRQLVERARAQRQPIIFDTDDLVFEPDLIQEHRAVRQLSPHDQLQHTEGVRRYLETLEACDTIVTATPLLAEFARRRAKPAYVHRNALGREMVALAKQLRPKSGAMREQVIIGYGSGTATHDVDFAEAAPALAHVLERFAQVELWIAGPLTLPTALDRFGKRVRRFPLMEWRDWFALLSQMDIALAPLEQESVFCRAKSEIKFVEAGALGVPVVASRIDPYHDAMTDGRDGFLAASTDEWFTALSLLIEQPDERERIGLRAREIVWQRHSPKARTHDLRFLLPQLAPAVVPPARRARPFRWPWRPSLQKRLKINWLVPEPFPGAGGDVGIFRIIRYLAEFGHDCQVYVVTYEAMTGFSTKEIRAHIRQHFGETRARYHRFDGFLEDADCSFATFWPTVENLTGLLKGGRRYYLVQDFEPDFYPDHPLHYARAENTYRAGLRCVTLGPWLTELLRRRYHAEADYFNFAVDTQLYRPRPGLRSKQQRVCFYARPSTPRRAYELGLRAFALVRQVMPEVEIVFFGAENLAPPSFPIIDRGKRSQDELADLFSSCAVGVVFSMSNPSFVPLEMIASGAAVVEIASERWEKILTHGKDAWLVEATPSAVANGVIELLQNKPLRERLVRNGLRRTRRMSWRDSARQVENILLRDLA